MHEQAVWDRQPVQDLRGLGDNRHAGTISHPTDISVIIVLCPKTKPWRNEMLFIGLLEETGSGADLSWLLWVALAFFAVMTVTGWLTSRNKKTEDKPPEDGAQAAASNKGGRKKVKQG
jgi:hypothetical protein